MTRTLVLGGRIVVDGQDFGGDILIEDGHIASVGSLGEITADVVIDAAGRIVFPGDVDPYTYLDTLVAGAVVSDDFESGPIAGVVRGTTAIVGFAVQEEGTDPWSALEVWHQRASSKAAMDFAFDQIITPIYLSGMFRRRTAWLPRGHEFQAVRDDPRHVGAETVRSTGRGDGSGGVSGGRHR